MPDYLEISGRVRTIAYDGVVAEAQEVKDLLKNKSQQELNNDFSTAIEAILLLIPSAASSLNQLADKAFVNSSIATASATFRGTYNLVSDLNLTVSATHAQIGAALAGAVSDEDNNDYAFVQVPTSDATPTQIAKTERYKFNGTTWEYEYDLNNSGYTADQWAAINSGINAALVSKLSALPTNADLTTALGVLTDGIAAINAKIPSAASSSNKLVDTAAMQSYITQVLDTIDATFNVTSTDGHVTVQITQVNGVITNVAVTTSDIASAADMSLLDGRVTTAEGNISTNTEDIAELQDLYNALQQSAPVVIEPTDTWPVANPSTTVIYRVVDRVNTPPQYYSDYMFRASDLTTPVLMAQYDNAIDPRPKKGSQNLVTSGGVFDNMGALDVSELNATENPHTLATYADLSAAIAAIPSDYRKGGMTIRFVQSSDNKYVQFRYMGTEITGNPNPFLDTANWQGVDEEPTVGSNNLVKSGRCIGVKGSFAVFIGISDRFAFNPNTLTISIPSKFQCIRGGVSIRYNNYSGGDLALTNIDDNRVRYAVFDTSLGTFRNANSLELSSNEVLFGVVDTEYKDYYFFCAEPNLLTQTKNAAISEAIPAAKDQTLAVVNVAKIGFALPISGTFSYVPSTKTLSFPTSFDVIVNNKSTRYTYAGSDVTFVNTGDREQLLIFNTSTKRCRTFGGNSGTSGDSLGVNDVILGAVDINDNEVYFNFRYTINGINMVQNGYDSTPTPDSTKLLTSGAVKEALSTLEGSVNRNITDPILLGDNSLGRYLTLYAFIYDYIESVYWTQEQTLFNQFVTKIQARQDTGVYQIALITDTHEGGFYPLGESDMHAVRCVELFNKLASSVDICVHGGDISCDYGTSVERNFAYMQEAMKIFKIPSNKNLLITKGNHDSKDNTFKEISPFKVDWDNGVYFVNPSYGSSSFTQVTKQTYRGGDLYVADTKRTTDSMFRFIQATNAPSNAVWGDGAYYYYDVDSVKIRFVVANSYPIKDDGTNGDSDEWKWFAQTALDLSTKEHPTDWLVVVVRHTESTTLTNFTNVATAFMSGTSVTIEGVTVNYGTLNGGGINIVHLHGHEHDSAGYSNMRGYLDIGFRNGCATKSNLGNVSKYDLYVLSIDTINKKLVSDTTRNEATLVYDLVGNILELNIGQTALMARSDLADQSSSSVSWASSDDNIATVNKGKVTGVSEGVVTITATQNTSVRTYTVKVVNNT